MMRIPLSRPDVGPEEIAAVTAVLRSGRLALGPELPAFEAALRREVGVAEAVAVSSGTAALDLALRALEIGPGDEVLTTPFSFVASANAARHVGARPVFADIDAESLNLDPEAAARCITPRTKALLVVHVFGRLADMRALEALADAHGLPLVEDACEALGAAREGRRAGAFGRVAAFGFYPNKVVTTGEGGALLTDDHEIAARARRGRNQGRDPAAGGRLEHVTLGFNHRLSELACALGRVQLERLEDLMAARDRVATRYRQALADCGDLVLPPPPAAGERLSWFVFVVRLGEAFDADDREAVAAELAAEGIATGRYFPPIHLQPAYRAFGHRRGDFPVTESVGDRVLALPFHPRLAATEIDEVAERLRAALARRRRGLQR